MKCYYHLTPPPQAVILDSSPAFNLHSVHLFCFCVHSARAFFQPHLQNDSWICILHPILSKSMISHINSFFSSDIPHLCNMTLLFKIAKFTFPQYWSQCPAHQPTSVFDLCINISNLICLYQFTCSLEINGRLYLIWSHLLILTVEPLCPVSVVGTWFQR